MNKKDILKDLIQMSRNIGNPEYDYVILAEGNTSAKIDDNSFYVKASGFYMENIDEKGFVEVSIETLLLILKQDSMSDDELKQSYIEATSSYSGIQPSIESILHAICINLGDAHFVCHTHPTAVNAVLCSRGAKKAFTGMIFPDEITVCGPAVLYIDWAQPGLDLAKKVWVKIEKFKEKYNMPPRVIVMQNHGLIALGQNSTQVENVTHMFVKACRIRHGTFANRGPRFLDEKDVYRIIQRPDEKYRENLIFKK
jgi:rhamnose utilization protein RhaD (predicted bifunctional aldolase and dehydrogenase)